MGNLLAEDLLTTPTRSVGFLQNIYKNPHLENDRFISDEIDKEAFLENGPFYEISDNRMLCKVLNAIHYGMTIEETAATLQAFPLFNYAKGIQITKSREKLYSLLHLYNIYKAVTWNLPTDEPFNQFLYLFIPCANEDFTTYKAATTKKGACISFASYLALNEKLNHRIFFLADGEKLHESFLFGSLYEALFYQLLLHIECGEDDVDGATICFCQQCGNPFIQVHKKTVFCKQCGSDSERARRYRNNKKKEAASNGTKENP